MYRKPSIWVQLLGRSKVRFQSVPTRSHSTHNVETFDSQGRDTPVVPYRKKAKEDKKKERLGNTSPSQRTDKRNRQTVPGWELTVGVEIHAQLNSAKKLFSPASTSSLSTPNEHVAPFDLAIPGSQPILQKEILVPALRAAIALGCEIQPVSRFDRKHYFWWDQPAGYQITQFYEPLARNGHVWLYERDGIAADDGTSTQIDIKQVQLEQDTAKSTLGPDNTMLLDFNRVGTPLMEIITEPQFHHPRTVAAFVRKIQLLLQSVDACTAGMEAGGLRADINVSVRRTSTNNGEKEALGTRTEIKNLGTIKAIEDAVIAERDRQIRVLEEGGTIYGETRGWSLGSTTTRRLRGKEGEVDYRYMPDPDIPPLRLGEDILQHFTASAPTPLDTEVDNLIQDFGLSVKDAMSLLMLDNGHRIEYFYKVWSSLRQRVENDQRDPQLVATCSTVTANWVLHEFGRLTTKHNVGVDEIRELQFTSDGDCHEFPASRLEDILYFLLTRKINAKTAKALLIAQHAGDLDEVGDIREAIDAHNLWFKELSLDEYQSLLDETLEAHLNLPKLDLTIRKVREKQTKILFASIMRSGPSERIDPPRLQKLLDERMEKIVGECNRDRR